MNIIISILKGTLGKDNGEKMFYGSGTELRMNFFVGGFNPRSKLFLKVGALYPDLGVCQFDKDGSINTLIASQ